MIKYEGWLGNKNTKLNQDDEDALRNKVNEAILDLKKDHEMGVLHYLNLPTQNLDAIEAYEKNISTKIRNILVLGIGGSSLGPRAVYETWVGASTAKRKLYFSENIDSTTYIELVEVLSPADTLVCVITKSGSTIETMAKFWHLFEHFENILGPQGKEHFIAITDPEKGPLRELVGTLGLTSFELPSNVGGRFSVMTSVGLVPLALVGFPIKDFLLGAQKVEESLINKNGAIVRACMDHIAVHEHGFKTTVMMPYLDRYRGFSEWFCQLWGESLAKNKNRIGEDVEISFTPLRALGTVDQHSQLQLFIEGKKDKHVVLIEREFPPGKRVWVPLQKGFPSSLSHLQGKSLFDLLRAEAQGTQAALDRVHVPTTRWLLGDSSESIGAMMMMYMIVTSVVGIYFNINPYDQPGVEFGKRVAHGLLGRAACEEEASIAKDKKAIISDL